MLLILQQNGRVERNAKEMFAIQLEFKIVGHQDFPPKSLLGFIDVVYVE